MNRPLEDSLRVGGSILVHGPGMPCARVQQLLSARHGPVQPLDWRGPMPDGNPRSAAAELARYLGAQRCGFILLGHELPDARRVALAEALRSVGPSRPIACLVALSPDAFPRPEIRRLFELALSERLVEATGVPA